MIRFILILELLTVILISPWALQREAERIELESAFNECIQDLNYKECRSGVYGVQD